MDKKKTSSLVCKEIDFTLESYGKSKTEALGDIFAMLKKRAYKEVEGLIIHMEPKDVYILEEKEQTRTQKLVGFFKPKQIQNYYVKVLVTVTVKYVPL